MENYCLRKIIINGKGGKKPFQLQRKDLSLISWEWVNLVEEAIQVFPSLSYWVMRPLSQSKQSFHMGSILDCCNRSLVLGIPFPQHIPMVLSKGGTRIGVKAQNRLRLVLVKECPKKSYLA